MMQLFCVLCFEPTSGRQYLVACFVRFSVELQCDLGLKLSNSKFLASVLWVHSEGQTHCGVVNGSNRSSHAIKVRGQTSSSEDLDKTVRGFEISLDNCFTSALPMCESHLLHRFGPNETCGGQGVTHLANQIFTTCTSWLQSNPVQLTAEMNLKLLY